MQNRSYEQAYDEYFKSVTPKADSMEVQNFERTSPSENNPPFCSGNIGNIDELAELVRVVLNTAWGSGWGSFKPFMSKSDILNSKEVLPLITYDLNSRDVAEKTAIKPIRDSVIKETLNGIPTGDVIDVYRQSFDNVLEFNIWGRNSFETRKLVDEFEILFNAYIGYFKRLGVAEILFLREIPSNRSVNFIAEVPMRSLMYNVRLERVQQVRQSTIKKIDVKLQEHISSTLV